MFAGFCACGFAGFAGAGFTGAADFAFTTGAVGAVRVAAGVAGALAGFVVETGTVACAGFAASGLRGLVVAGCATGVLDTACCTAFVVLDAGVALVAAGVGLGMGVVAFGSQPGMLVACPFCAFLFFLKSDPILEIALDAFETVEATWLPALPAAPHGFDMALPIPPCAYDVA